MNYNKTKKIDILKGIFGIFIGFCILFFIYSVLNSTKLNRKYEKQNVEYVSLIVEKHTKVFKIETKNPNILKLKILKFYVLDEYGDEYQINQIQYDTIDCSQLKDSIHFIKVEKIFEVSNTKQTIKSK